MTAANFLTQFTESSSAEDAISMLRQMDEAYFNDEPLVSDSEYDAFRIMVKGMVPTHPYFLEIGSKVRGEAVPLPFPMASLDQVHLTELPKWLSKHPTATEFLVTDKMDGASVELVFEANKPLKSAFSRGDALEGADITRHISKILHLPTPPVDMIIRAEVEISNESFEIIKTKVKSSSGEEYKNPRNMISGLMNRKEAPAEVYEHISVICYQVLLGGPNHATKFDQLKYLEELGFEVPHYETIHLVNMNDQFLCDYVAERKRQTVYDIDGVVVYLNDLDATAKVDADVAPGSNPKSAFKYKILQDENIKETTVKEVIWTISKHAYYKPVVVFESIELNRVSVNRATAFNAKFVKENNIGPGAKIQITRSGDVIPFILQVVEPASEPQLPDVEYEWTPTGVDIFSTDQLDSEDVKLQQLVDFCESMDFPHLREAGIRTLMERGKVSECEDIITLDMLNYIGILGANGSKIYDGIHKKLAKIDLWTVMGSTPFFGRGVGRKKFKKLINQLGPEYTKWSRSQIIAAESFDEKTADKILAGIPRFEKFFASVQAHLKISESEVDVNGPLAGEKVCITGFRDQTMSVMVETYGGSLQSGVSGKTTILVCTDVNSNSGKAKKARDLTESGKANIRIVSREDFQKELERYAE